MFDPLTTGISATDVVAAIMSVAGVGVAIVMASGGAKKVLGFLSGVFGRS